MIKFTSSNADAETPDINLNSVNDETSSAPADSEYVTLRIGTERFTVLKANLGGAEMLCNMVSGRWPSAKQKDGTYIVDSDPELFKHILPFLRTDAYPLFWDQTKGHDFGLYAALQHEAYYLGAFNLAEWLKAKKYLEVVDVNIKFEWHEHVEDYCSEKDHERLPSNISTKYYITRWTREALECPRGIAAHTALSSCGWQCKAAEDPTEGTGVLVVRREIFFANTKLERP